MNIDANVVMQKLTRQIADLSLQIAILQAQVEMLQKKIEQQKQNDKNNKIKIKQYVTSNTQPTHKQDNKPTIQSEIEPNLVEHNIENISE